MTKYIFYCMNAILDGKTFTFQTDEEAIKIGIDYEADVWKLTEHEYSCIYSPYEGHIAPEYLQNYFQTASSNE